MIVSSRLALIILALISLSLPACNMCGQAEESSHKELQTIVVTSPVEKDVIITQQYVCQIRSQRNIDICAQAEGFLLEVPVKEGQAVKKGDVLFQIFPVLYQAKLDAELARVQNLQLKCNNTNRLYKDKVVSQQEVFLIQAELAEAEAKRHLAEAELNFATVKAPFDGIVDRLLKQQGSQIKKDDALTTLSDNSLMWVYFNVPEARYLEYMANRSQNNQSEQIELVLANGSKYPYTGKIGAIEARFNNETGNIPFRADFPNPDRLLRHGQTGNILVHQTLKNALVIPQRATFEILDKRYVWVVGHDDVVHQREIEVVHELDDIFVIKKEELKKVEQQNDVHKKDKEEPRKGLDVNDKIILEGVRQIHDGERVEEFEFRKPEEALANQKNHAE